MLEKLKKEFDYRHDFEDSDIQLLKERHPSTEFSNIPAAWICLIDEMLCRLRYAPSPKSVRQEFGQLIVLFESNNSKHKDIINACEEKLKSIDIDLQEKYGL